MVKVFLLKDVANVGKMGAILDVKEGFAQNMLFSKKVARIATAKDVADAKNAESNLQNQAQKRFKMAQKFAQTPAAMMVKNPIRVEVQTSAGGRVHGSVEASQVVKGAVNSHPILKNFAESELAVKLSQKVEYVGKYGAELTISLSEDGRKQQYTVPVFIDVVSISEAKRKSQEHKPSES